MAISEHFYDGVLPNVLTTLYTFGGPPGSRRSLRYIYALNGDALNAVNWYIYVVKSGDVAGPGNRITVPTEPYKIKPGKGKMFNFWVVMHPGATIQGYCDGGDVNIFIDGAKETS